MAADVIIAAAIKKRKGISGQSFLKNNIFAIIYM
jgi:hypothetical protein